MKKFLAVTLAAIMLTVNSVYAYENINVYINGQQTTNGILVNGHTLVPLRVVAEAMGCGVDWDASTKTVTISDDMRTGDSFVVRTFSMTVGSNLLTMKTYSPVHTSAYNYFDTNDIVETMDCCPIIENGNTMVPLRVISEHFNIPIQWDGEKREVKIGNDAEMEPDYETEYHPIVEPNTEDSTLYIDGKLYRLNDKWEYELAE